MKNVQSSATRRVLYLTWRDLDHPEAGGAEVFAERTAEELATLGHDVVMFSSRFAGAPRTSSRRGFTIIRRGGKFSVYLKSLVHLLRHRASYDVVLDVQNGVPFWSPLVFRGTVINVMHHVHREQWSSFFPAPVARFGWFLESKVAPRVYRRARYVTVSQASRSELVELGVDAARVDVVYNGLDLPDDHESYADVARTPSPSLVTVGRMVPHKRFELAINALHQFRMSLPDLELHIVGDGAWMNELMRHAARLGVDDRVTFHGFLTGDAMHRVVASSWVMAVPSVKEGWGLTIVEAGLHRTPAVAFRDAGGTRESIHDGESGLLADDVEGFFDALFRLLTDDDYREKLGDHAREHALGFSWSRSGRELSAIISATQA